jgi:hypothetical protein
MARLGEAGDDSHYSFGLIQEKRPRPVTRAEAERPRALPGLSIRKTTHHGVVVLIAQHQAFGKGPLAPPKSL